MTIRTVGIAFGGVSPEHEVSIITSLQAASVMDRSRYRSIPLYLSKDGTWHSGDELLDIEAYADLETLLSKAYPVSIVPGGAGRLRVTEVKTNNLFGRRPRSMELEVVFVGLHGGAGENGGLQGLCEVMDVPYTGSGVLASALAMDKVRAKEFCRHAGIPVVPSKRIREPEWADAEDQWMDRIESTIGLPVVVKPVKLGSSIGISRAANREELDAAVEEAFRYDEEVVVEKAVTDLVEINCGVLGDEDEARASVLEQPVASSELLSYEDKYMSDTDEGSGRKRIRGAKRGGNQSGMASLDRIIPAPIPDDEAERIRAMAVRIFRLLGCSGVARIDFLVDGASGRAYFNEINTIPGSLSFYLWEPEGFSFEDLVDRLIELAFSRYAARSNRVRSYDVNLLSRKALDGLKGSKS